MVPWTQAPVTRPARRVAARKASAPPDPILLRADPISVRALQRTAGNRAVRQALSLGRPRAVARCAGGCTCGGSCHDEEELEEPSGRALLARAVATAEAPTQLLSDGATAPRWPPSSRG